MFIICFFIGHMELTHKHTLVCQSMFIVFASELFSKINPLFAECTSYFFTTTFYTHSAKHGINSRYNYQRKYGGDGQTTNHGHSHRFPHFRTLRIAQR